MGERKAVKKASVKKAPVKTPTKQGKKVGSKSTKRNKWQLVFWIFLMLVWVGASTIVAQLVVGRLMVTILGREVFVKTAPVAIYTALSYVVAMFLVILVPAKLSAKWASSNSHTKKVGKKARDDLAKTFRVDRTELGLKDLPTWTDIGLAPVGLVVALLLAMGLTAVFNLFPWFDIDQTQQVGFSLYETGVNRVIAFITLAIIAPIAEEIIFRGWLYGKLRERTSHEMNNVLSIILSSFLVSLIFGMVHMQWNVGLNVFAMSLVMCGLREITGTIYAGILLHMLKNGLAFFLMFVLGWR